MHNYNNVAGLRHFRGALPSKAARFPDEFRGMRECNATRQPNVGVTPRSRRKAGREESLLNCWCE
jgi:hypothetical protein